MSKHNKKRQKTNRMGNQRNKTEIELKFKSNKKFLIKVMRFVECIADYEFFIFDFSFS